MVGFLGMMAAGAAMGARDASNNTVRAQNELEIGNAKEQLREEYANKKFDKELEISKENTKAAGLLKDKEYQRNRVDKQTDSETEYKRKMELENVKESGRNTRSNQSISAADARSKASGSTGDGSSGKGITLPNGEQFIPSSPEYKFAVDLVRGGEYDNISDALKFVISKGLVSQAAGSMSGLRNGAVPESQNMTGQLLGSGNKQTIQPATIRKLNPDTGKFE